MLEQQQRGTKRQRPREPDARMHGGIAVGNRLRPHRRRQADFSGERLRAEPHLLGRRFDVERERHREILRDRQPLEQDGARADDADAIDDGEPLGAVADRRRRTAEEAYRAGVGQRRAGDQIDEYFGGGQIESDNSDGFRGADGQLSNAQRPEGSIVLRDAGHLEDGRGHEPSARFTSSTILLDADRADNSVFSAARLQAMAP